MIQANSLFAQLLKERGVPAVFRTQPPPLEKVVLGDQYDPVTSYRAKKALAGRPWHLAGAAFNPSSGRIHHRNIPS